MNRLTYLHTTVKRSTNLKTAIRAGIVACSIIAVLQASCEILVLSILYNGFLFRPQDLYKSQVFLLLRRILDLGTRSSIPFLLDRYLGPDIFDKTPVFLTILGVHAALALITGLLLGLFHWLLQRRNPLKNFDFYRRSIIVALTSWLPLNGIIFLTKIIESRFSKFEQKLIFVLGCLLTIGFVIAFSKLLERLMEKRKFRVEFPNLGSVSVIKLTVLLCFTAAGFFLIGTRNSKTLYPTFKSNIAAMSQKSTSYYPNILIISIDSLRADHLSCYDYPRRTSPNIDALAKDGILFEKAFSNTSWTLPAHRSLFTSTHPEANDFYSHRDPLLQKKITLAEVLKAKGYATAAFVSGPFLNSKFKMDQGFQLYDDFTIRFRSSSASHRDATSPKLHQSITRWLHQQRTQPFFLFLHYWDVHYDYDPPAPYDKMFDPDYTGNISPENFIRNKHINEQMNPRDLFNVLALYDGEIAFTDYYIGQLITELKKLRLYDDSIVVLTADHGDEFFEHGEKGHMKTLYDEVLHIPLIVKLPISSTVKAGQRVQQLASIVDIMPTVLSYLGMQSPDEVQGRNLFETKKYEQQEILIYSSLKNEVFSLRSDRTKLIQRSDVPEKEFYDLQKDPKEQSNLYLSKDRNDLTTANEQIVLLLDMLNLQRFYMRSGWRAEGMTTKEVNEELEEQLKALGYIQ